MPKASDWVHAPRTVSAAMHWAAHNEHRDPANGTSWAGHCLASARQMYGLPVLASSAAILAHRAEAEWGRKFLHQATHHDVREAGWWRDIPRGAFLLSDYGHYGHAWVASKTHAWSTDYTRRGELLLAPRNLPRWSSISGSTVGWLCGFEINGRAVYIKGIECPWVKHEGKH